MKTIFKFFVLTSVMMLVSLNLGWGQTTYYWNTTNGGSWTTASN